MHKKILITGFSRTASINDYNILKSKMKIQTNIQALKYGLQLLGYQVQQREVKYGQNLNQYYRIITYFNSTNLFTNINTAGALWTLTRKDTLIAINDAYVGNCFGDPYKVGLQKKYLNCFGNGLKNFNKLNIIDRNSLDKLHMSWMYDRHILLPLNQGGDTTVFFRQDINKFNVNYASITGFNPNALLPLRKPEIITNYTDKKYQWFVAALSKKNRQFLNKYKKREKLLLPITTAGGKNNLRLTQQQAVNKFSQYWFNGVSKIKWSSGGWWRLRMQQIIDAGSICWCQSKQQAQILGKSWYIENINTLQNMSVNQLNDLVQTMRQQFYNNHPIGQIGKQIALEKIKLFLQKN